MFNSYLNATSVPSRSVGLSLAVFVIWLTLIALGLLLGQPKPVEISVLAFIAMIIGAGLCNGRHVRGRGLLVVDGAGAGMMVSSACVFMLPSAIRLGPVSACAGLVFGLLVGVAIQHHASRNNGLWHGWTPAVVALALHSLAAGFVIGVIYTSMPAVGLILGVAIVAHKLPAGYAVALELRAHQQSTLAVLIPACMVGIASVPTALAIPGAQWGHSGAVFGFATGIFIVVAIDFLIRGPHGTQSASIGAKAMGTIIGCLIIGAAGYAVL